MSLLTWLTGRQPSPPPPPYRIEPLPPATVAKQDIVTETQARTFSNPFAWLGGWGSNTGISVNAQTSLGTAPVYACVKIISEDIAGLDLQIRRRLAGGGWRIIEDHPLNRLFRRPNRWQSAWQFWTWVLDCYSLRGNAYIFIVRDSSGAPVELVPIRPDAISPPVMSPGGMRLYMFNSDELGLYGYIANPDDVMHLRNSISLDGITGLSPIAASQDVIGLALAAQQHGAVVFRQGGQIGGVLQHPGKLSKEAAEHIASSWRETHAGVQNAGKVAVLEEGMVFEKVAMTSEDAQLLETRRFQVIDIASRIFRVPPHKLGELGRSTYGNIEQQQRSYIDDCLKSHTRQIEGLCNDQLLFEEERNAGFDVHYDFTSMLQGDEITRFQAGQIGLLNGFLSINEVRSRENMNPIPGGDTYRVPLNTAPLGQANDPNPLHPETIGQRPPPNGNDQRPTV